MVEETQRKLQGREQELRDREETFRKRLDQRIDERLRDARREIDTVVDALKTRASSIAADADRRAARLVPTGDIGAARADARSALEGVEARLREVVGPPPSLPSGASAGQQRPAAEGDRVAVGRWASRESCSRSTTDTPKWTCAGSGCGRGSTSCG